MNSWLVQKQTALGKDTSNPLIVDSLLKTIWFSIHHHLTIEVLAIPGQTVTGKESSNPFMAGVNTPRSDEDRLKLMELMIFLLQKGVYGEIGVTAAHLSMSPHIYILCIKQFWNSVSVKRSGDVTRLQALVDKKKIVISEAVIRRILQLNDAEGMVCLPNEEIFAGLAQMGYEKPVRKGFSGVETPFFEGMITDRQPAEKELGAKQVQVDAAVAAAVVEDVVEDVAKDIAHVATPSPPPHGIPSPPQEPSSPPQQPHVTPSAPTQGEAFPTTFQQIVKLKARVKKLEKTDKIKSSKLRRLRKVGTSRQVESSDDIEDVFNQGRMINEDEGIELVKDAEITESEGRQADKQAEIYNIDLDHSSKVLSMQEDDSEVQEVVEVVTTTKFIIEVVTAAATQGSAASATILAVSATIPAAAPTVIAAYTRRRKGVIIRDPEDELSLKTSAKTLVETPKVKDKGKGIMIEAPKPMKKKDQIEMDAEYARKLQEEIDMDHDRFNKDVDWDAAMDHVNKKSSSNPQYIKRYQGMKKRPQTESEARKNMMIYLKNTAGYKMDFFKGMTYAQIYPSFQARFDENIRFLFKSREEMEAEDQKIIKSINETPAQKAAKRRKLATPLTSKVPIVDYHIVLIDNKSRYKIIRADDTHQLYISFTTLLKNFDREDLETLWRIVKDRFSTSKPTNFSDEYLLLTLRTMFEEPDGQDAI
nr:hypothetical protein [Tanacetum cinerariifolium]